MRIKNNNSNLQCYKSIILYSMLIFFALIAVSRPITLIYDVQLMYHSIFLLIMINYFPFTWIIVAAFLINGLNFIVYGEVIGSILFFMEIVAVFIGHKTRIKNLLLWDCLYWIVLGIPVILILSSMSGAEQNSIYVLAGIPLMHSIINGLISDIAVTYMPISKKYNENQVYCLPRISSFFYHACIAGIFIPFFIFVIITCSNLEKTIYEDAYKTALEQEMFLREQISKWPEEDIIGLSINSLIQIGYLKNTINNHFSNTVLVELIDLHGEIIAANIDNYTGYVSGYTEWTDTVNLYDNFNLLLPNGSNQMQIGSKWIESEYVYSADLYDMKLIIRIPVGNYSKELFRSYILYLRIAVMFFVPIVFIILILSRILSNSLNNLVLITTGLPEKLFLRKKISWPSSSIYENKILIDNFKVMARNISIMLDESKDMYEKLCLQNKQIMETKNKLHVLAYYDDLTGLPNRNFFTDTLKKIIDKFHNENSMQQKKLAVMLIDLDRFKHINDTLGHSAGDILLKNVGEKLVALFGTAQGENHLIGRLGGDEFIVVVWDTDLEQVHKLAHSIIGSFNKPVCILNQELYVAASIGISFYPDDGDNIDEIIMNADTSMYSAKEAGGNTYHNYAQSNNRLMSEEMHMEHSIRRALDNKEFVLYYQPKIDARSSRVCGIEALIRWMHPDNGLISPDKFIPIAERTGLIIPIGEWVLREATRQNREWQDAGYPRVPIAVNWSARQFRQLDMVKAINEILNDTGLDPEYLELEITEGSIIKNTEQVVIQLNILEKAGIRISIDDFGTGYSSLGLLRYLPIYALKIDRSFVKGTPYDQGNVAIVKAILQIASNLNLRIVAEGIETKEEETFLTQLGCDELQGYYYSKPLPKFELEQFLKSNCKSVITNH